MSNEKDHKLNLPKTSIPMKANLNQREPEFLKEWDKRNVYKKIRKNKKGKKAFHLHDGPPYANGEIHLGHAVNKVLKDIIIRSKSLEGFDSPYIPGWDCHGLPIEHQVEKKLGKKRKEISKSEFRDLCREYAKTQIKLQERDFVRLGVFGDWKNRYASLDQSFEGEAINAFSRIFHNGHVEKGLKPVHWCLDCGSSLAEAEVDYLDKTSRAIDVKFRIDETLEKKFIKQNKLPEHSKVFAVIWTTTPWTIPGNQAVCLNKDIEYSLVEVTKNEIYIIASELVKTCFDRWSLEDFEIIKKMKGNDLDGLHFIHPLYNRTSPLLFSEHVTTDTGTGCVHSAPAHGPEDFETCSENGIELKNPISSNGCFKDDVKHFGGLHVRKSEEEIIKKLKDADSLLCNEDFQHSYPHCWRHKTPLIFMATPQWFISMTKSGLLEGAEHGIDNVEFTPAWGKERMQIMLKDRPDWCISRQRDWGIPIPLIFDKETGEPTNDIEKVFNKASEQIKENGIDAWKEFDFGEDKEKYEKSNDIFDVWFDSGITHHCVMNELYGNDVKADLYLEGSDQHRGWFQSSLLTSVAMNGTPPYKGVLTHGFVVDEDGRKMSKSIGNVVGPLEIINNSGADTLRFWIAATDFRGEMAFSKDIFNRSVDGFRRIRNTMRFMISNLYDYDQNDQVTKVLFLDKAIISKTAKLQNEIRELYKEFNFHQVVSKIVNFCVNDLGSLYLDVIKDRLYTMQPESEGRRSAQYALAIVLDFLNKAISPILPFTAYEFSENLSNGNGDEIFYSEWEEYQNKFNKEEEEEFELLVQLRQRAYQEIEEERKKKDIKNALDCDVEITLEKELFDKISKYSDEMNKILICSSCSIFLGKSEQILVKKSVNEKCTRCWHKVEELENGICKRCINNMSGEGEVRRFF